MYIYVCVYIMGGPDKRVDPVRRASNDSQKNNDHSLFFWLSKKVFVDFCWCRQLDG